MVFYDFLDPVQAYVKFLNPLTHNVSKMVRHTLKILQQDF